MTEHRLGSGKVVHIITRLNVGGAAAYNIFLCNQLQTAGYDVILITGYAGSDESEMLEITDKKLLNFKIIWLPELVREVRLFKDLVSFFKLARILIREKPLIVHTHLSKAGLVGRLAARLARVPVVIHSQHNNIFEGYFGRLKSKVFVGIERVLAPLTDLILTDTDDLRRQLQAYGIGSRLPVEVMHLGIDMERFKRSSAQGELDRPPTVGWVGRLVPIKDASCFLRAAARVLETLPSARFVIVGDGELREQLESMAAELGISDRVAFLGFRKDVQELYADFDAMVLTSHSEGACLAVLEAMASGVPVVSTPVGGVPDVVVPGRNGYLFKVGDSERCAELLSMILKEPKHRIELSGNAMATVRERFTIQRSTEATSQVYQRLLSICSRMRPR